MSKSLQDHYERVYNTPNLYTRIDSENIPSGKREVRLFVIARNEALRLPYFLDYYLKLGIDRIFFLDNNSTDNTREIALSYPNTHVFKIDEGYKYAWYWMEFFLEQYGKNRWCVVADVDELMYYPYREVIGLKELIRYLEMNRFTALKSLLLDMYSDVPICDTQYMPGEDPLQICRYFDTSYISKPCQFMDKKHWMHYDSEIFIGGVRQRIFGTTRQQEWNFCLSKVPLFKHSNKTYLNEGMHAINGAKIADIKGAMLHTKFMQDFIFKSKEEAIREQFWQNGAEHKIYNFHLSQSPDLILKNNASIKFINSKQLIQYDLMQSSPDFDNYIENLQNN